MKVCSLDDRPRLLAGGGTSGLHWNAMRVTPAAVASKGRRRTSATVTNLARASVVRVKRPGNRGSGFASDIA